MNLFLMIFMIMKKRRWGVKMKNPLKNTEPMKMKGGWKKMYDDNMGVKFRKGDEWIQVWKPAFYKGFRLTKGRDRVGTFFKKEFKTKKQALKYAKTLMR